MRRIANRNHDKFRALHAFDLALRNPQLRWIDKIVCMILSQGMGLALVGVVIGVAAAFALTSAVKSFLFGVTPNDPATFFTVAAVLAAAALAACYLPARRAAQVDPLRALRTE